VGCGTARRLRDAGARLAVGVDLVPEMLARAPADTLRAVGDVRALPFPDGAFDVVWCRLVIGHVRELDPAYRELARVCRGGGAVVVTDLRAEAVAAGHRRTFRDEGGTVHEVEHHVHPVDSQVAAAGRAGLALAARRGGAVGAGVQRFYAEARRLEAYEAQLGLPLVVALAFRKGVAP
jgi:malonyl-CoA O-methyltransferase